MIQCPRKNASDVRIVSSDRYKPVWRFGMKDCFWEEEKEVIMAIKVKLIASTTSTNDEIKKAIDEGKPEGFTIRALRQTAGRGRNGHTWTSPAGSLYISTLLRPDVPADQLPSLSLLAGLAVYRMLASYYEVNGKQIKLKWPNDVMVTKPINGKLAGILVEAHGDALVLGLGLNVNEPQNGESIDPAASYVTYVANIKRLDTADFGREFLEQFYALYERWLEDGFAPFKDEFNEAMLLSGRTIELLDALGNSLATGIAQGVDERGYLVLLDEDGSTRAVASGEVRVLH